MSPWMASQVMPRICSRPASRSVMFLVLQKAMARSYAAVVQQGHHGVQLLLPAVQINAVLL